MVYLLYQQKSSANQRYKLLANHRPSLKEEQDEEVEKDGTILHLYDAVSDEGVEQGMETNRWVCC